ncbi:MAG: hypothetical protein AB3N14_14835 [Flavobacteriaceae bacterium]
MSFTLAYKRFFTVKVKEQTTNKAVRSLSFTPTSECDKLLNNYGLVFKSMDDGFEVYYKSYPEASNPIPSPISDKIKFSFGISINDPSFVTAYEPVSSTVPQFYLDNLSSNGNISSGTNLTSTTKLSEADLASIKQQTFTQRTALPGANNPSKWFIKEKFTPQTTLQTVPIEIPNNPSMPFIYVVLNDPDKHEAEYISQEGPYVLETDKADPPSSTIYLSTNLKQSAANGILDIYWNSIQSSAPATTGKTYQIILKPQ